MENEREKRMKNYFKIDIEEDVLKILFENKNLGKITLDEKYYHERSIKLMKEAQEHGFEEAVKEMKEKIDKWEKENQKSLQTEDIIKKKIIIADYVKWDKIKELKKSLGVKTGGSE